MPPPCCRIEEKTGPRRDLHFAHFFALAKRAEPYLTGPEQEQWMTRLQVEHDNLRAALAWSLTDGPVVHGSAGTGHGGCAALVDARLPGGRPFVVDQVARRNASRSGDAIARARPESCSRDGLGYRAISPQRANCTRSPLP